VRYFFDFDGFGVLLNEDGIEFANIAAARNAAIASLPEAPADAPAW
jgi:hypothetical protein